MPNTPEMVEAVARAISGAPFSTASSRRKAVAAIQAMREPTDAQRLAAYEAVELDDRWDIHDDERWAKSWRAGIDAALAMPGEGD